jgi:hypothetical protein
MRSPTHVPRPPSTLFIKVLEQLSFDEILKERDETNLVRLCDNLSDAILAATHRFGAVPSDVVMYRFCDQVVLSVTLEAGAFKCRPTFMAKISKGLCRQLCTRILRFLRAHKEALG